MPKVVYREPDGSERAVDASDGESVMSAAVRSGVPGIVGECGGQLSCATCHVWVKGDLRERAGERSEMEEDLLDMGVSELTAESRLGCQITMCDELDGLVVEPRPEAWH